eukprot:4755789-Heterocapsa_arctica.AAC.1
MSSRTGIRDSTFGLSFSHRTGAKDSTFGPSFASSRSEASWPRSARLRSKEEPEFGGGGARSG